MNTPLFGKTLVICPHFDDACFSIGGLLLKKGPSQLSLLTVFSKTQHVAKSGLLKPLWSAIEIVNLGIFRHMIAVVVSSKRQKEDRVFCDRIHASQIILPFRDFSLRRYDSKHTRGLQSNVFCLVANIEKEPVYNAVLKSMEATIFSGSYDCILCPLAVSNHIDHLMVEKAFLQIIKEKRNIKAKIFFYEDLPYLETFNLEYFSFLAQKRVGTTNSLLIDVTSEISLKQNLVDAYKSQYINEVKPLIVNHAKRLFRLNEENAGASGYCEKIWPYNSDTGSQKR
jgi:hypothetical protein